MPNQKLESITVLEILNRTKTFFEKKGVPDPLLDAQYIISHGLGLKNRMDLYLNFEKPLMTSELDTLRTLVARRANREPLQHIIGNTSFRGFNIKCDKRALIPRPETEELVDMAKNILKDVVNPFIVEVGTGTSAISIACAKEIENVKIIATDISFDAITLAKENAKINEVSKDSLCFVEGDLLEPITNELCENFAQKLKIDCLIANLPYIPECEKENLQVEVLKYDPHLALFGGLDGLYFIRNLLKQTENRMNKGGVILLEIGSEQGTLLEKESVNYPWLTFDGMFKDFCGNIRFVRYIAK